MGLYSTPTEELIASLQNMVNLRVRAQAEHFTGRRLTADYVSGAAMQRIREKFEEFDRLYRRHCAWQDLWERDAKFASAIDLGSLLVEVEVAQLILLAILMGVAAQNEGGDVSTGQALGDRVLPNG